MFLTNTVEVKMDIPHREGSVQGDAFEAACSGAACEAPSQERDDADEERTVPLPSVAASASPSEDAASHVYLLVTHSSDSSGQRKHNVT